jgi:hypothetical protein
VTKQRLYLLNTESGFVRQQAGVSGEDAARRFVLRYPHEIVCGYVLAPKLTPCDVRGEKASSPAEGATDGR